MGQRSIRFPDELEARIKGIAVREDRSFSKVVLRALESVLGEASATGVQPPAPTRMPAGGWVNAPVEKGSEVDPAEVGSDASTVRSPAPSRPAKEFELPKIAPRRTR
jgi:hypothetical protein